MSINTQLYHSDAKGTIYAAPNDPNYTVRFKTTKARKSLRGLNVDNYVTEIIINDLDNVTVGDVTAVDALSVRLKVSGSEGGMDRLKLIVSQLAAQVDDWADEHVFLGFAPVTLPVYPEAAGD